jgi:hypothetical protein
MPEQNRMPWRSVRLPQLLTLIALVVGVPLFLRAPPWCDITLYQLAARNLIHGGVHYRDLFDTNLPGYVWVVTGLYWLFGPSALALRVLDLAIVTGIVALGDRFAKWGGASAAARWWAVAAAALFYPFTAESAHAQRDVWMLLPALAAVALRVRRAAAEPARPFRASCIEGALWGAAVWIKPHVGPVALAVWVLTAARANGGAARFRAAVRADLLGNLCGGAAVGIAGAAWLVLSGAWRPFLDVMLVWNPLYMKLAGNELGGRFAFQLVWFPPWSLGHLLAVPLAVASVWDAAPFARRCEGAVGPVGRRLSARVWDRTADPRARFARGALGALYLAWAAQALFVQRAFHYVHVPETLLMFALFAAHGWRAVAVGALHLAACGALWLLADAAPPVRAALERVPEVPRERWLPRHPLADPKQLRPWPDCWRLAAPDAARFALWDRLRRYPEHEASIGWEELNEVAEFLRAKGAGDGEVVGWFDSPHAVYLLLDVEPGFRFMHVFTALVISAHSDRPEVYDAVYAELGAARRARYVISDLEWLMTTADGAGDRAELLGPPVAPTDLLPAARPCPRMFPFNQPTVFRSRNGTGRYVVHELRTRTSDPEP